MDASSTDWRSQLPPEIRQRVINKLLDIVQCYFSNSISEDCISKLKRITAEFEGKTYTTAINKNDYQQKICQELRQMVRQNKKIIGINLSPSYPTIRNLNSTDQGEGAPTSIYANAHRQIQGRRQQQQTISQPHQQQPQKMQHPSLLESSMQQQQEHQQSLWQPTHLQSSMHMPSSLESSQPTIQETSTAMKQSSPESGFQQNQQNSVHQSLPSLQQQHPRPAVRQEQPAQPTIHQRPTSLQQYAAPSSQQSVLPSQQQMLGQHLNMSNMQPNLMVQMQDSVTDVQQQQPRLSGQQNNLLSVQLAQQLLGQQNIALHQEQQLSPQSNISEIQQRQQQQLLGSKPTVWNINSHQCSMHTLQETKSAAKQQQTKQPSSKLLPSHGQQSQHQPPQQQLMSHLQSQPIQLQERLVMQQQPDSLQREMPQRLQASDGVLLSENAIEQFKQSYQSQRVLPQLSCSRPLVSAQTGHAGVVDCEEEIYQKIKTMNELYLPALCKYYQRLSLALQQCDTLMLSAKQSEKLEKWKNLKFTAGKSIKLLLISRSNIQPCLKDQLPLYEKDIVDIISLSTREKSVPQTRGPQQVIHPGPHSMQQQHSSQVSQLQQHYSNVNQLQEIDLPAPPHIPGKPEKQISGISLLPNTGNIGHKPTASAPPQAQSLGIGTIGKPASSVQAELTSIKGNQADTPTVLSGKLCSTERPVERLIRVVQSLSSEALRSSVRDVGFVVSMIDRIPRLAPSDSPAIDEDSIPLTRCHLQDRNFMSQDVNATTKNMKRRRCAVPLNIASSACNVNDNIKQSYCLHTSESESTSIFSVKRPKIEVNQALLEEIRVINPQLIDQVVNINDEDVDLVAAAADGREGTIIKCSFDAVALSPKLKSQIASAQMSPIKPLRLLVPADYPKCSPVVLDKLPVELSEDSGDLYVKAKARFSISLHGLSQPISLREMARTWDICAREVIAEYAQQTGGGTFSSRYGTWEICGNS